MKTVTAAYAKVHLPALLKRVKEGERITISHYNKPIADLVPTAAESRPTPKFGTGKSRVKILDPHWARPLTDRELEEMFG